jgi:outer membrane receptor protein involved in Fe transport
MGRTDARLLSALLILFVWRIASAADSALIHFDIPAGDAQRTLLQFVSQANIEMLYSSDDVRGVVTHAVSGNFTVPDALGQMINGTGLEMSFERDYTFASIKPMRRGKSRGKGGDEARVDEARNRWSANASAGAADGELEQVIVTGTLLRGVADIVSPTQVQRRDDVGRLSYGSVAEMAQMLPINSRAGPNESYLSAGNFTRGASANLRGLGAGATLVLIDGHRQAMAGVDGDFVDLSGIPWAAVERIDVVPDGQSALYGSDAIAGVVNVIMRSDSKGNETTGRMGNTSQGASERLASQVSSWEWSSGHALAAYQYAQRGALAASDRAYAASSDKRLLGGSDFRSTRASPGNILDPITLLPAYAIPASGAYSISDLVPNATNLQDRNKVLDLLPFRQDHSLFLSAVQDIGGTRLFVESRINKRQIHQLSYPNELNLFVPASNPYAANLFPGRPVVVGYSFADTLGPAAFEVSSLGADTTVGAHKLVRDWRLELSLTRGTERADINTLNQVAPNRLPVALADPNPSSAFNPFGPTSSQSIDFIRLDRLWRTNSILSDATFIADGKLWSSTSTEGQLAIGVARRQERLDRTMPTDGSFSRSVTSLFAELGVPIAKVPSSSTSYPRLELSAAGRLEDYSDFGSSANPRLAIKWAPMSQLRVRGSWGTSFRAPKLVDVYDLNSSAVLLAVFPDPRSKAGMSPVLVRQGANRDLHEETATTWTLGLDFAPETVPLHASLTYFDVIYRGRIVRPGPFLATDILREEAEWATVIQRDPTQDEINALCNDPYFRGDRTQCKSTPIAVIVDQRQHNMATTNARGLDLNMDASTRTKIGMFNANLRIAYTLQFSQRGSDASPSLDIVDTVGNPLALKLRAGAEWRQRPDSGWTASLGFEYSGGYRDPGSARGVGAFKSIDVAAGYMTGPGLGPFSNLSFELTASNLLNAAPPFVDREAGYDLANAVPYGRVTTLMMRKRW